MSDLKVNDDGTISVDITVRNVGDCEGKDVVELYYTAPYIENGIEKSHVVLLDFAKTATLQPAQAEELTFTFAPEDMASFDYITEGCYVLDAGDYEIKLMSDSHNVIDSRIYNVPEKIVYNNDNKRTTDDVAAVSLFQDAEGTDITYLSRSDWEGTWPKASEDREASDDLLNAKNDFDTEDTYKNDEDQMPVTGEDNGLKLADMTGLSYDDEKWELLLNEMTVEEMNNLVSFGGYQNIAVNSIGKPNCIDLDGPQGINEANQSTKQTGAASYPSEVVTACTWDTEIAELMGMSIGKEALSYNVNGWYAPACNIHRSPFGGRVFEYYSEDPLLSGKMSASCVQGAGKYGVYCYVKHFAVNETETHRDGLYTWLNEQSLREIYLKPFEIAVKEGNATGIMSAFNRLGTVWCGGNKALMTNVLRDEWGFRGAVVTDYYIPFATFMNPYSGIMAGNDLWLAPIDGMNAEINPSNATIVSQLRNASHNILYMVANSNAVDTSYAENANIEQPVTAEKESLPLWAVLFYGIFDLVYVIVLVVIIVKARKNKQIKVTEA